MSHIAIELYKLVNKDEIKKQIEIIREKLKDQKEEDYLDIIWNFVPHDDWFLDDRIFKTPSNLLKASWLIIVDDYCQITSTVISQIAQYEIIEKRLLK